jgi:DNA-binding beta-propeller fold protein YncE
MVISPGLIVAVPPDGTQLVGFSRQTGKVDRVDGEGFAVDDRVVISESAGIYVGPGGVYAFSAETGTWAKVELPPGAKADLKSAVVGTHVITLTVSGAVLAYSGTSGTWTKLDLSAGTSTSPAVSPDMASVEADGHLYVFSMKTAKWTTLY